MLPPRIVVLLFMTSWLSPSAGFAIPGGLKRFSARQLLDGGNQTPVRATVRVSASDDKTRDDGVIELVGADEQTPTGINGEEKKEAVVAPFLSQGEISEDALNPDLSDPKQTRVIIYTILSLLPVLFLIPLMLGSREFLPAIIPMDELPPVQM